MTNFGPWKEASGVDLAERIILVRFGSREHPCPERVFYLRPAEDATFHWVLRADGERVRIHEHQMGDEV